MEIEHTRSPLKAPIGGGNQLEFLRKVPVGQFCVGSRQRGCDSHDVEPGLASSLAIRGDGRKFGEAERSEEHTSELQSLMRISYAVFCLKKQIQSIRQPNLHT